jgi:hypothetical protein
MIIREEEPVAREVLKSNWIGGALAIMVASATNFVWVTMAWAQGTSEGPANQGTSVLDLALVSAMVTALAGGFFSLWRLARENKQDRIMREEDRQQREEALLRALHAEIPAIRSDLWMHFGDLQTVLRNPDNVDLRTTELFTSTEVYRANIGSLGEITDGKLVGEITSIYADLDTIVEKAKYITAFVKEHGLAQDRAQRMVRGHYKNLALTLDRIIRLEYILGGITNRLAQQRPPTAISSTAERLRNDWSKDAVQLSPDLERQRKTVTEIWYAAVEQEVETIGKEMDNVIAETDEIIKRFEEEEARLETEAARGPTPEEEALIEKRVDEMLERLKAEAQKEEEHKAEEVEDNSAEKPPPS